MRGKGSRFGIEKQLKVNNGVAVNGGVGVTFFGGETLFVPA